ncbi:MAG: MiaB/RimO family radical SAM methylthiotransferase [bacterium]|nr:MiaB/RimO family radical SAM methylthiotransferase [Candidatus Margulisiibacteriota bacterium]
MSKKKIAFYTLGCRANQYQTEALKSQLTPHSSHLTPFSNFADTYVINTCTVTHDAERKSCQAIRRALRQNPKAKILVAGCFAKLAQKKLLELFPQIEFLATNPLSPNTQHLTPRVRTNLMIQDGCENFCSYCLVPFARGKIKSKPFPEVIREAKTLVKAGAREIILTGINLGTYQHDLINVLKALSKIKDLVRIRLSSIEPMYITKKLIRAMANIPKVCNYLHIPLQSGDNKILKAMNRNYTVQDYLKLIAFVRKTIPHCGLSTDIIVGFPGEGDLEFQNTFDLIKQIGFSRLHIFSYSKRAGTAAAGFSHQVEDKVKKQRNKTLRSLGEKLANNFAKQSLKKKVEVLVEQPGKGLTTNFIRLKFAQDKNEVGQLKKLEGPLLPKSPCSL